MKSLLSPNTETDSTFTTKRINKKKSGFANRHSYVIVSSTVCVQQIFLPHILWLKPGYTLSNHVLIV